jgi:hypothetical protein
MQEVASNFALVSLMMLIAINLPLRFMSIKQSVDNCLKHQLLEQ